MAERSEIELAQACQRGDRDAMESLVRLYEKPVFNIAYRMLGNRDDAADIAQTTFLKAFQNIDQFNPAFKFFSWIYRIAMNESINHLKRRRQTVEIPESTPSPDAGPEMHTQTYQVNNELELALGQLSDDYRGVIVLRYFADCSYAQMAEILRIPEKTVKSRLYSARRRIKDVLVRDGVSMQ